MKAMLTGVVLSTSLALVGLAHAQTAATSPEGLWRTIDDKTGKPRALVRITKTPTGLQGQIEKFLAEDIPADAVCDQCTDERKGKPLRGMVIVTGLTPDGDTWGGGKILDPKSGSVYSAQARLTEAGQRLELKGYLGVPLLGRTQTWQRVE